MSPLWGNIITALGVLAGASLTGSLALLKGRQDAKDKSIDRAEARRTQRTEHRRETYAAFLSQARVALVAVSDATGLLTPISEQAWEEACDEASTAVDGLYDVYVELALSGPPSVADAAERLWFLGHRAVDQVEGLWGRIDQDDHGRTPDSWLTDEDPQRITAFVEQQKKVIELARKQLGGDLEDA
ncbi:hypothetical protein ACIREM_32640 [Streptomyces shenzhenensis]|uniref:hypothetical protein n=1 Tax=Streptomyces shenzhenensis TaxID=943815 RepID=UPI003813570C